MRSVASTAERRTNAPASSGVSGLALTLLKNGIRPKRVARKLGISRETVSRISFRARKKGVEVPTYLYAITDADKIVALRNKGLGPTQIAQELSSQGSPVSRAAVSQRITRMKKQGMAVAPVTVRVSSRTTPSQNREIVNMARNNMAPSEIAQKLTLPSHTIRHKLSKARKTDNTVPRFNSGFSRATTNVILLAQRGTSLERIASLTGKKKRRIIKILSAARGKGIQIPKYPSGTNSRIEDNPVVVLANRGFSTREIARRTRLKKRSVVNYLSYARSRGIQVRYERRGNQKKYDEHLALLATERKLAQESSRRFLNSLFSPANHLFMLGNGSEKRHLPIKKK
jgi:DNA-binding CsgD family transcriptional regulator